MEESVIDINRIGIALSRVRTAVGVAGVPGEEMEQTAARIVHAIKRAKDTISAHEEYIGDLRRENGELMEQITELRAEREMERSNSRDSMLLDMALGVMKGRVSGIGAATIERLRGEY